MAESTGGVAQVSLLRIVHSTFAASHHSSGWAHVRAVSEFVAREAVRDRLPVDIAVGFNPLVVNIEWYFGAQYCNDDGVGLSESSARHEFTSW